MTDSRGLRPPHLSTVLLPDRQQGTEAPHLSTVLLPDRQQGTEAPHLSTVLLHDRQQGAAGSTQQRRPYSQGQGGHRARPVGATGRDKADIGPVLWELQPGTRRTSGPSCGSYSQGQGGHRARPVGATARDKVDIGPVLWELQAEKSACNSTPEGCVLLATNATWNTPASPAAGMTTQAETMHQLVASEVARARQVAAEEHQQHTARHRGHSSKSSPGR